MRIDIGDGVRLYVDVDGLGMVPTDGKLEQRPTLLLLHGGPGMDHSSYKLGLHEMRDVAQVVMYDHRGNGRSDRRSPDEWNLDTWADDVVRLCDALEINKPIVLGNSFGGFVAQRYIGRHPEHAAGVVLSSTLRRWDATASVEAFRRLGGDDVAEIAAAFWSDPNPENGAQYLEVCGPLYTQRPGNLFTAVEPVQNMKLFAHWNDGENKTFDFADDLAAARCPVFVMGGIHDPVTPFIGSEEIAAALPADLVRLERFEQSGHGVFRDEPERAMAALREFVNTHG